MFIKLSFQNVFRKQRKIKTGDLLKEVQSIHMTFSMTEQEKCYLLIQMTA
jgi:hypothetical protein